MISLYIDSIYDGLLFRGDCMNIGIPIEFVGIALLSNRARVAVISGCLKPSYCWLLLW